jgi:iron-sulfur cluster assembly protein
MMLKTLPVSITDKAFAEIKHIIIEKNISSDYGLRIGINGGGCSGVSYALGFDKVKAGDDIYSYNGITIYIGKKHAMFILSMEIDFEENQELRGFVFKNIS